jgi:hypothetical protein
MPSSFARDSGDNNFMTLFGPWAFGSTSRIQKEGGYSREVFRARAPCLYAARLAAPSNKPCSNVQIVGVRDASKKVPSTYKGMAATLRDEFFRLLMSSMAPIVGNQTRVTMLKAVALQHFSFQ